MDGFGQIQPYFLFLIAIIYFNHFRQVPFFHNHQKFFLFTPLPPPPGRYDNSCTCASRTEPLCSTNYCPSGMRALFLFYKFSYFTPGQAFLKVMVSIECLLQKSVKLYPIPKSEGFFFCFFFVSQVPNFTCTPAFFYTPPP